MGSCFFFLKRDGLMRVWLHLFFWPSPCLKTLLCRNPVRFFCFRIFQTEKFEFLKQNFGLEPILPLIPDFSSTFKPILVDFLLFSFRKLENMRF